MPQFALRRPRGFIALAGIAALTAAVVGAQAPDTAPTPVDQVTARFVAMLLEKGHISKPQINDEVAVRWAENYIKSLDPLKYNFLRADIDEFMADATELDDRIQVGDVSFAKVVFDRFIERSDERLAQALELLDETPDFTIDETIVDDPKLLEHPRTTEDARERLRKRIKLELLSMKVGGTEDSEEDVVNRIRIRYKDLNRIYHGLDSSDLLERYLTAMTMAIDPQSTYMHAQTLEDFEQDHLNLSLEGIGASLTVEDGMPKVVEIVPGGAADKDGRLMPDDKIVGVEDADGNKEDFYGKKLSDVVRKIRGPAGTKVRLLVQPADTKEIKPYEVTRQKIELTEQHAKGKVIDAKGPDGQPIKIGVIDLPGFYGDSLAVLNGDPDAVSATLDVKRILADFKKQGVDAVVLDLRMNGGGLLSEGITLSGLFIDKGPVVQVRGLNGVRHLDDDEDGVDWDGPLAVLVNHFSASASEIFAGVIKDYGRGLVIGDSSTYGKGTVQQVMPLNRQLEMANVGAGIPNLGALKLTIQQFYRPSGASTQIKGIKPDVHIPSLLDHRGVGEGENENALPYDELPPLPHDQYGRVTEELIANLQKRSDERRSNDPEFQKQAAAIERYLARKARNEYSLNEEKFRAETAAEELDSEEAKAATSKNEPRKRLNERVIFAPGAYNDEVVKIIADYVSLGGEILTAGPVPAGEARRPALRP